MADIFDNPYSNTSVLYASGCTVQWAKSGGSFEEVPVVMLGISASYSRRSTPIYPINSGSNGGTKYIIMGSPQGTLQVQSIYAPTGTTLQAFMTALTGGKGSEKSCNAITLKLTPFSGQTCKLTGVTGDSSDTGDTPNLKTITLSGVTLNGLSLDMRAGDAAMVNMNLSMEFTSMAVDF